MNLKEDEGTTTSDMANATKATNITGKAIKRKRKQKDKEDDMSAEKNYKIYEENHCVIFEYFEKKDYDYYIQGLKSNNLRYWRNNEVTSIMMEEYQKNRHTGFRVKYQDQFSSPLKRFNDDEYSSGYSRI